MILADKTHSQIKTDETYKDEEPFVERTTFGWLIHAGEYSNDQCKRMDL